MIGEILKGLFTALRETGRGLWAGCGRKTRLAIATGLALLVAAFFVSRVRDAFQEREPDWLRRKQITSPSLDKAASKEFVQLLELAQRYAKQHGVPLGSVRLWEIERDGKNTRLWTSDRFANPGFRSLQNFERAFRTDLSRFVGYYTGDARPLEFTVKHTPTRTNDLLLTVHLPRAVHAGESELAFRVERQPDRVKPTKDGKRQLGLGRMPGAETAVHLWAVRLPSGAQLVRCAPAKEAAIESNGTVQVSWVNARLGTAAAPVSVVFAAAK